jgi:hydroxymethylpyrimidine/phosphomethylpyrimidine kinase
MKTVLTIAGSDCSGGAGIQADLKTFEAFGVFGCSVITVLTAQNTKGVTDIQEVSPQFVKKQIETILDDFDINAIKIGMLYSNEIIDVVKECIKDLDIPIVFDPVFISKAGSKLLNDDAIENLKTLLPLATVSTPNFYESRQLFKADENDKISSDILKKPYAVVKKNSVITFNQHKRSVDTLYKDGKKEVFDTPYIATNNTHGTGCSFSSAIAANLALGETLQNAVYKAKKFIYLSIKHAPMIGHGKGPINHKTGGDICHIKRA